jgi:hypothetical protein
MIYFIYLLSKRKNRSNAIELSLTDKFFVRQTEKNNKIDLIPAENKLISVKILSEQ